MISYWQSRNKEKYDHIIIGGGISGLSIAYHLTKRFPNKKIALLEKNDLFYGASGRNAGFLTIGSMNYCSDLINKSENFIGDISDNISYMKRNISNIYETEKSEGALSLAYSEEELDRYVGTAEKLRKYSDFEIVSSYNLKKEGINAFGAVRYLNEGSINPMNLLKFLENSVKGNIDFFYGEDVYDISGNTVLTRDREFLSEHIYIATNIYTNNINFKNKDSLSLTPARNQVIAYQCDKFYLKSIAYSSKHFTYFRQTPDNVLILGGARIEDIEGETTIQLGPNEKILSSLKKFAENELSLINKKILREWSGIMAYTKDGLPLVGSLSDNIHILAGMNGHGMGVSFPYSKKLIDYVFDGIKLHREIDVKRFIPE
tara:strand:+ start:17632 stop:18753 length:1122 start_codon:yes stop_codon:yes gene_type:complete